MSATSSVTLGSTESRISTRAWPTTSIERTRNGRPIWLAVSASLTVRAPGNSTREGAWSAKKALRSCSTRSLPSLRGSLPAAMALATAWSVRETSRSARASTSSMSGLPSSSPPPEAANCSSADSASRADPRPLRTASSTASGDKPSSASSLIPLSRFVSWSPSSSRNSKCCVRDRIVGSTFWGSVVASTNTTRLGGSSRVFSRALAASEVSWWTSSMM